MKKVVYVETYKGKPINAKICASIMQALLNKGIAWEDIKVTKSRDIRAENLFVIFFIEDVQSDQNSN